MAMRRRVWVARAAIAILAGAGLAAAASEGARHEVRSERGQPAVQPRAAEFGAPDLAAVVRRVDRSLVHIELPDGFGSGFLLRDSRTIVTAAHVLGDAPVGSLVSIRIVETDEEGASVLQPAATARVHYIHPDIDLAVLEWSEPSPGREPLEAHPSPRLLPRGSEILLHGFPGPMAPTVARGLVSAHHYDLAEGHRCYLLDAAMGAGLSGGAVTDLAGRLVGVGTAVYDDGEASNFNWAYAIPLRHVLALFPGDGGVASIPATLSVESRIAVVRAAEATFPQWRTAFEAELAALIAAAPTPVRLLEDLEAFLAGLGIDLSGEPEDAVIDVAAPAPRGPREFRAFAATALRLAQRLAERGTSLSMRYPSALADAEDLFEAARRRGPSGVAEAIEALPCAILEALLSHAAESALEPEDLSGVLDALAESLRAVPAAVRRRCDAIVAYEASAEFDGASIDRGALVEAIAALDLLPCLLDLAEEWGDAVDPEGAAPRRLAAAATSLGLAAAAAREAYLLLPAPCREIREELDALDPAALRAVLAERGYRRRATIAEDRPIAPRGWIDLAFEILPRGDGSPFFVLVAEGSARVDLDLVLFAPDGRLVDEDWSAETFAQVAGAAAVGGLWTARVVNSEDLEVEGVTAEVWTLEAGVSAGRVAVPGRGRRE